MGRAQPSQHYDFAVVGAGVAGCYCAFRLACAFPAARIGLFERAPRIGGRLESVTLPGVRIPVELGGAFVTDLHVRTLEMLREVNAPLAPLAWSRRFSFVRGHRVTEPDFRNDGGAPYAFAAHERGRTPHELLHAALSAIAPDFVRLWPMNRDALPAATDDYLRQRRIKERLLGDWEIGALLRLHLSEEAYQSVLDGFGAASNLRGANAYDAIRTLLEEMAPQAAFMVSGAGFAQLPTELARRSGAALHLQTQLVALEAAPSGVGLICVDLNGDAVAVTAGAVILALPPQALAPIRMPARGRSAFDATLAALAPVPACKLFMAFDQAWWPRGPGESVSISAALTDLPMQQCYCYDDRGDGRALMLAVFADEASAEHWRAVRGDDAGASASASMIAASRAQLRDMHPDCDIPAPAGVAARYWPAAWHQWKQGAPSWRAAPAAEGPHFGLPIYLCGEAVSMRQGWVEGALASVDGVLARNLRA